MFSVTYYYYYYYLLSNFLSFLPCSLFLSSSPTSPSSSSSPLWLSPSTTKPFTYFQYTSHIILIFNLSKSAST